MRKHCVFRKLIIGDYLQVAGHHQNEEFAVRGKEPKDEVQIYTWKDATLRELTDLVSHSHVLVACDILRKNKMLEENRFSCLIDMPLVVTVTSGA